jgi:hypothetical protein
MPHTASQNAKASQSTSLQWPYAAIALAPLVFIRLTLLLQLGQSQQPGRIADFVTYWASGRLFLSGLAPYSPQQMLHLERWINPTFSHPQMMLCPPWNLPLFALFGAMAYPIAHLTWFFSSLALDLFSAVGLWLYFGGSRSRLWIPVLLVATFLQMGATEAVGQITPLILAGLTGFLLLSRKNRYFLAGMCLFVFGIKPQLLYLVFLAILIWIVRERRWSVLAGALTISLLSMLAAAIYNPLSLDYFHSGYKAAIDTNCGIGGILRNIFGRQHTWMQYVPTVFGAAWFVWYTRNQRGRWNWRQHLPLLTLISISTAAYGWYHDFILILPAIIAVTARGAYRSSAALVCYVAAQVVMMLAGNISRPWMFTAGLLWIPLYLYLDRTLPEKETDIPNSGQPQTV